MFTYRCVYNHEQCNGENKTGSSERNPWGGRSRCCSHGGWGGGTSETGRGQTGLGEWKGKHMKEKS